MRVRAISALLLCSCLGFSRPAESSDWRTLVQPIGTENDPFLIDPSGINIGYAPGQGPWETSTMVTSITTTTRQFFVRFYNPSAPVNPSNQEGSWVMRASEVRGLTPEQVRNKFALPNLPSMMTLGLTTTGGSFYTGLAGPISGWGDGGGQQSQQKAGPYTSFFNGQAVMASVLDYTQLAGTSNGRVVGSYLMAHSPAPYSDMETVYNSLDVLYNPSGKALFEAALSSIGPERYDNLFTTGLDAAMLHHRTVVDRLDRLRPGKARGVFWAAGVRDCGQYPDSGFDNDIGGVIAGIDKPASDRLVYGVSVAWLRGIADWNGGGRARSEHYRGSAYIEISGKPQFLQFMVSAGSMQASVSRQIDIGTVYEPSPHGSVISPLSPVSRLAVSSGHGWDADIVFRGGSKFEAEQLLIIPAVEAGCLYQSYGAFREAGAESIDLIVSGSRATTLHSLAGFRVERPFLVGRHERVVPYVHVEWEFRERLDRREVTASLNGWPDTFTVTARHADGNRLAGGIGATLLLEDGPSLYAEACNEGDWRCGAYGFRAGIAWGL
ncbi:MAG: autotransporter outer membrane beta-barrel domain-containing protein [Chlorobiaceae bacterium]|nr:autotransporter outer membrane beta-barrel domain-containing protein [Chlorobiaceae bacterium]